ncbi:MAG: 4Fe-4S binding protein [Desulfurococcales archaeon]|nr:4Fe-4S binding protein [Desulfurococcales archaeon]
MVVITTKKVIEEIGQLNVYTLIYDSEDELEDSIISNATKDQPVLGLYSRAWENYPNIRKEIEKKGSNFYLYHPLDTLEFNYIPGIDPRHLVHAKHSALLSFMAQKALYKIRPTKTVDRRAMLTSPFKSLFDYYPAPMLIQPETCKSWKYCNACVETCPFEALSGKPPQVNLDKCTGCGLCTGSCPFGLILMPQWNIESLTYLLSIIRRYSSQPGYVVGVCNDLLAKLSKQEIRVSYPTVFVNVECPGWFSDYHILASASKGFQVLVYCSGEEINSCGSREMFEPRLRNMEPLGTLPKILIQPSELAEALSKPPTIKILEEDYSVVKEKTDAYKILSALGVERVKFTDPVVGLVKVDDEKCLVCDACSNLCPFRALERVNDGDETQLIFHPDRCTACGICEKTCPYDALKLDYEFNRDILKEEAHILARDEIAKCKRCGKPIGSKKHLLALERKLKESGVDEWVLEQLWLCQECKMKTLIERQLLGGSREESN